MNLRGVVEDDRRQLRAVDLVIEAWPPEVVASFDGGCNVVSIDVVNCAPNRVQEAEEMTNHTRAVGRVVVVQMVECSLEMEATHILVWSGTGMEVEDLSHSLEECVVAIAGMGLVALACA